MIAGNIMIGRDIVIGTGDLVLVLIIVLLVVLGVRVKLEELRERRYKEEMLQAAQELEIGDGVTLLQGIQAYFGVDGLWSGPYRNGVCVRTKFMGYPKAGLRVYPETGQIEVLTFHKHEPPDDENDPDALLGLMIQAVREQRASGGM